jgi:RNA polymerase sigma factor (sigma-70 family)
MLDKQNLLEIPDQELLLLIKEDQEYLSVVYKKTKDYCMRFMKNMVVESNVRDEELQDIYQDSLIILYEKIIGEDFKLTASFQTYLNSVCRYQVLNKFKSKSKLINLNENSDGIRDLQFDPSINDVLREIGEVEDSQFKALDKALRQMKEAGGKCYEILTLFWYHKKSLRQISEYFGYSNEANTKVQKSKCQKRLHKIAYKELNC